MKGRGEHASAEIGCGYATLSRILHGHNKPSQLLLARFKELGIFFEPLPGKPVKD